MWGICMVIIHLDQCFLNINVQGFPGGTVVKNPPAKAGDTGLSRGRGRSHMMWSN